MAKYIEAVIDGKGIGRTVNALAKEKKISPVGIRFTQEKRKPLAFNSIWAATDWLKENGFYNSERQPMRYEFIYPTQS